MRDRYRQAASLEAALRMARESRPATLVLDVEPLVAGWGSGQRVLDHGVSQVTARAAALPGVRVVCFATNSARRPSAPASSPGARVVYLASAGKPLNTAPYRDFPLPGVLIGDQVLTDGLLARRLGYAFVHFTPQPDGTPPRPRLLHLAGRPVRPMLFRAECG